METSTTLGDNALVGTKLKRLKGTRKQFYLRVLSVRKKSCSFKIAANAWDVALQVVTPEQLTSIQATVDTLRGKVQDLEEDVDGIAGNVYRLFLLLNCNTFCFSK